MASPVAAAVSSTVYEIGMFGWMAVMQLVLFPVGNLSPIKIAFWVLMQVGFIIGLLTSCPAEWWLIQRGFKETMGVPFISIREGKSLLLSALGASLVGLLRLPLGGEFWSTSTA